MKRILSLISLAFLSLSCDSSGTIDPLSSPQITQPVATGIFITTTRGPEVIGVWGSPADYFSTSTSAASVPADIAVDHSVRIERFTPIGTIPKNVLYSVPYPNPTNGSQTITIAFPMKDAVSAWVVPARFADAPDNDVSSYAGATVLSPVRQTVKVLVNDVLNAGEYSITFNPYPLPAGFYRIYVKIGETLMWHDILYYHDPSELPAGLKQFLQ